MPKSYFVINDGRIVYRPGHYDEEGACRVARNAALLRKGREYKVFMEVCSYKFPKIKKTNRSKIREKKSK